MKLSRIMLAAAWMLLPLSRAAADNVTTTVDQVDATVTLTDDVDYIVTSATPFAASGVVDIQNTDHAVLILDAVRPSAAIGLLSQHVRVGGQRAVNNVNCQVKLHSMGTIIMPYASSLRPLTVYSEQNFGGDAVDDFGLENSGGYMNTLTDAKLNNRIRSFRLKRGYMVTFSTQASGRGYSRCFIAADKDVEMATLPALLDRTITSYRVFKWYDTGKRQLANDLTTSTLAALNVQSSYTWSQGHDMAPDYECVPNHIYEDYPSSSAIGQATWSPHSKNNNEPRNQSDDHPQDLTTILNNWQNMMRTGMRLCTPASWDGSDYWNATGFLAEFLDSIDARGWRCDIIDLHCYWAEGNFGNIANWVNKYRRPVWISEWCWGASWNSNGAFASGVTEAQVRDALERICTRLNGYDYVERYYYWNGERDPSRLYKDGKLTPAGEMYAKLNSGVGYNGRYDFVPKAPPMRDPANLTIDYDKTTSVATLSWHEYNGEYNQSVVIERRQGDGRRWEIIADVTPKEAEADYTYDDAEAVNGYQYRVHVVDANGKDRYTAIVMAASNDLVPGDAVQVDGQTRYLGGNLLLNGDFDMGSSIWTNGTGEPVGAPYFQVVPVGGSDGGAYLQCYGNGSVNTEQSLKTAIDVKPQTDYYFSGAVCNYGGYFAQLNLSADGVVTSTSVGSLSNATANWLTQFSTFNSGDFSKVIVGLRSLAATAQFDKLMLCQLFESRDEALADAAERLQLKAEAFRHFNTLYPQLNDNLPADLDAALRAYRNMPLLNQLMAEADALLALRLYAADELGEALVLAREAATPQAVNEALEVLSDAIEAYRPQVLVNSAIKQPKFASADGWTTKCGTYTGGDQRTNSQDGKTFWNAWWSGLSASEGTAKTMAVRQEVTGLDHGLYALECKATTEHYCLSDQHGYISNGDVTQTTAALTADYFDLPTVAVADRWQTLTTVPVYVGDGGTLTVGFEGSKQGATDNAWHRLGEPTSMGDKREGWWCATDFTLRFTPLYRTTIVPGQWGVTCLPYAVHPSEHLSFYEIAGITADLQNLCLRQMEETVAGQAFIYMADAADVEFREFGKVVTSTTDAPGNLRGFLKTSARVPRDYYYLADGQWVKVGSSDRPTMTSYTGILRPLTDSHSSRLAVYDAWDGPTMPIVGMTAEEMAAGVASVAVDASMAQYFTTDGRRLTTAPQQPGMYIRVAGGQARKIIIR